jgi:putative DNA primase/helicase
VAPVTAAATVLNALRAPLATNAEPIRLAEAFRKTHHEIGAIATLVRYARAWWRYDGIRFVELDDEQLVRDVYRFLDVVEVEKRDKEGGVRRERVTAKSRTAGEVQKALLKVMPMLGPNMPQWTMRYEADAPPEQFVACSNGLLDMRSLELVQPNPRLFVTTSIGAPWDPKAEPPKAWLAFLDSLWGDDRESIRALQQIFGYLLTPDTSQQKLFALVGPKRSGKSTIGRILKALLGDEAVVNPTLGSLERPFGLAPFVGKTLAIIGDARLGGRGDQAAVVERLLSISGEDPISIDRKNRDPINVRLRTRVLLISNELPRLYDTSGALSSRFLILSMSKSFLGEEDVMLERRLLAELPGIFRWAVEGRQDLAESGRFLNPAASEEAVADLDAISAPHTVFLRDVCRVGEGCEVEVGTLYKRWQDWCETNGREPGNAQVFGRDLRTILPQIRQSQRRQALNRVRVYEGVSIA